jgi:hypothetical protein
MESQETQSQSDKRLLFLQERFSRHQYDAERERALKQGDRINYYVIKWPQVKSEKVSRKVDLPNAPINLIEKL